MDRTYRIRQDGHVRGFCSGLTAVKQSIWKILHTQEGQHLIYGNSGYGIDWEGICAAFDAGRQGEAEQMITAALMKDERIQQVENIQCVRQQDGMVLAFEVTCTYGSFLAEEVWAYV